MSGVLLTAKVAMLIVLLVSSGNVHLVIQGSDASHGSAREEGVFGALRMVKPVHHPAFVSVHLAALVEIVLPGNAGKRNVCGMKGTSGPVEP